MANNLARIVGGKIAQPLALSAVFVLMLARLATHQMKAFAPKMFLIDSKSILRGIRPMNKQLTYRTSISGAINVTLLIPEPRSLPR
jgi:hypothetical protein